MKKTLKIVLGAIALGLLGFGFYAWLVVHQQGNAGLDRDFWARFSAAKVEFDEHGIATIEGENWLKVIEAQGFVEASERLWQMDLIRRRTAGRLAEWFGEAAFDHDRKVQLEDRMHTAVESFRKLPAKEREVCAAYVKGVNQFIAEFEGRWGIEYKLLGAVPEPWTCEDSLLVVMAMAETLMSSSWREVPQAVWSKHLTPAWTEFLFPVSHPWNRPYFGTNKKNGAVMPPASEYLPLQEVKPREEAAVTWHDGDAVGSNNWAYRGKHGYFMANDTHLGYGVPNIWYGIRLRKNAEEWAVGASIPGVPGIVVGMTPYVAWGFTNTGEDVDDLLKETVSEDGRQYLAAVENGQDVWLPVREKNFSIHIKGDDEPRMVKGMFTHRGPMKKIAALGGDYYSRSWLPLLPGYLRLPVIPILEIKDEESFHRAMDGLTIPSQNVLWVDRHGNMGYRTSGIGIERSRSGRWPGPALKGEWLGIEDVSQRRRLTIPYSQGTSRFLATANERVWVDPLDSAKYSEDRKERIVRYLSVKDDYRQEDIETLFLDTQSRFRQLLLRWIAERVSQSRREKYPALVETWSRWDGDSRTDVQAFGHSEIAETALMKLLLDRVRDHFFQGEDLEVKYRSPQRRSWLTTILQKPGSMKIFGYRDAEVADFLLAKVAKESPTMELWPRKNRWQGQHPFVGRVPIIGSLFAIEEVEQYGSGDLVDASRNRFGPSFRLLFAMSDPKESTWAWPVGQSGHLGSPYYQNFHQGWFQGERLKIFATSHQWEFPQQGRP